MNEPIPMEGGKNMTDRLPSTRTHRRGLMTRAIAVVAVALTLVGLTVVPAGAATDGPLSISAFVMNGQVTRPGHWVTVHYLIRNTRNRSIYLHDAGFEGATANGMTCIDVPPQLFELQGNSGTVVRCSVLIPTWYTAATLQPQFDIYAWGCRLSNPFCVTWWHVTDRATIFVNHGP